MIRLCRYRRRLIPSFFLIQGSLIIFFLVAGDDITSLLALVKRISLQISTENMVERETPVNIRTLTIAVIFFFYPPPKYINGLKSDDNFFQFLSQLEIVNKLQQHGFDVSLEVQSINNRRIDIIANKNRVLSDYAKDRPGQPILLIFINYSICYL